jgi:uncharacterized damage-inducible protein DinB
MVDREEPSGELNERAMLRGWLDYHRATLAMKCDGLTHDQLRERSAPPSVLSLLGLVRHMAEVEQGWFQRVVGQRDVVYHWCTPDDQDADFDRVGDADVDEAFSVWAEEMERARRTEASVPTLDTTFQGRTRVFSLRWVLTHMIEEYARHNGHADLLRERIDGATGA